MSYFPHAAIAAVKQVNGSIVKATLVSNLQRGVKYQILTDVDIFGIPGSKTLIKVRYFGPITLGAGGEMRTSPAGFYDEVIGWASQQEDIQSIASYVSKQLAGTACTVQNLGGRWIIR